jgi:hypothetical protein
MKRFSCAALAASLAISACAADPGFVPVSGVREISQAEATQCRYISDFTMTPPVYGPLAGQGLRYTRNKVMSDARNAGANAIIFDPVAPGADVTSVHAVGYQC